MPQQGVPPTDKLVFVPGRGMVRVPAGSTVQEVIAGGSAPTLPLTSPGTTSGADLTLPYQDDPKGFVKAMGKLGLDAAIMGAGMAGGGSPLLARTALRTGLTAPLGAARGALDENSTAGDGAMREAALTMGGEMGGHFLPRAGLWTGLNIGGALTRMTPQEVKKAISAYLAQAGRMRSERFGRAIPIGANERISNRLRERGEDLAFAETQSPVQIPVSQFRNLTDDLRRTDVGFPVEYENAIAGDERRFFGQRFQIAQNHPTHPGRVDMRETGNIARDLRNSPAATNVINAKINKQPLAASDAMQGQFDAHRAKKLREMQDAYDPSLRPLNAEISDLHTMADTNAHLRSGGGVIGDLGVLSMRGALGELAGRFMGAPPLTGTAAGLLLLSPANLSRAGFLGGSAAQVAPHAVRAAQTGLDMFEEVNRQLEEDRKKQEVRRRTPGSR